MYCNFFFFVTFVGSIAAFDGKITLLADKLDSFRSKAEASFASRSTSTDYEISEEIATTNVTECIKTEKALRDAVRKARTKGPIYTIIEICTKILKLSGVIDSTGIDVSNKWVDIRCGLSKGRCTLNGQERTGFFIGRGANIKIDGINFVKSGLEVSMGFFDSTVQISRSSFKKNTAYNTLYVWDGDFLKIDNVTFVENSIMYTNVLVVNVTRTTISTSSFKSNKEHIVAVQGGAYLEIRDVIFEQNVVESYDPIFIASVSAFNVTETNISGSTFQNNGNIPLIVYAGKKAMITNSLFNSNSNNFKRPSAILAWYANVTLTRVSIVNNILSKNNGNSLGSAYSRIMLDGCTFANNDDLFVSSNRSSSIRVLDNDEYYNDGLGKPDSTITCSNTKFCDGFPSNAMIVDDKFKQFDAPTCTVSLDC